MDVNYVLYGEEAALIRKKISNIAKKASLATDRISTYDALQTPLKVVLEDVSTMPFFEENKKVVAAFSFGKTLPPVPEQNLPF